jgi:hypothetical protein
MFSYVQDSASTQVLTAGTEALVSPGGLSPVNMAIPPAPVGVVIRGRVNATGGATGGGWSVKCRKAVAATPTVSSTQVGATQTVTFPATTTIDFPFAFVDTAYVAQTVYTITLTAAGSNGTVNDVGLEIMVPEPYGEDV